MTTRTISLVPEPGTPAYDNFLRYMRDAWADPRNVNFRVELAKDAQNMRFLTQGGSLPLPEVKDPVRPAIEVQVTLLLDGVMPDPDRLLADLESTLTNANLAGWRVVDALLPEDPKSVTILDKDNYRPGDHFTNPLRLPENGAAEA